MQVLFFCPKSLLGRRQKSLGKRGGTFRPLKALASIVVRISVICVVRAEIDLGYASRIVSATN
jgi:hypothetical protein